MLTSGLGLAAAVRDGAVVRERELVRAAQHRRRQSGGRAPYERSPVRCLGVVHARSSSRRGGGGVSLATPGYRAVVPAARAELSRLRGTP